MSKLTFFDTETNDKTIPYYAMSFGGYLTDENGAILDQLNTLIKPMTNYQLSDGAFKKHGIPLEKCVQEGLPYEQVLDRYNSWVSSSDIVIGHNVEFDLISMACSADSIGKETVYPKKIFCTMKCCSDITQLRRYYGGDYKWPKLEELYEKLFNGVRFAGAHDAGKDAKICMDCYFKAKSLGYIKEI